MNIQYRSPVPRLSPERLTQMINTALAQPQVKAATTMWSRRYFMSWARPLKAVLASVALLMVVGTVMSTTYIPDQTINAADTMADINELMTLDLLENLS